MAIVEECTLARSSLIFTRSPYWYAGPVPKLRDLVLSLFPAISLFQPECGRSLCVQLNRRCDRAMLRQFAYALDLTKLLHHRRRGHGGGKDEALCPRSSTAPLRDYCRTTLRAEHGKLRSTDNTNRYPSLPPSPTPLQEALQRLGDLYDSRRPALPSRRYARAHHKSLLLERRSFLSRT